MKRGQALAVGAVEALDAANRGRLHAVLESQSKSRVPWVVSAHRAEDLPRNSTHWVELRQGKLRRLRRPPVLDGVPVASKDKRKRGKRGAADSSGSCLIELRDVLFRKYQRKHLSYDDLASVEKMITDRGGTWETPKEEGDNKDMDAVNLATLRGLLPKGSAA